MKVTTEKLPKSLLAVEVELEPAQVEKGLDRAARRLSQKYTIPGFRKGKAPRFIIENYLGRPAILEEAVEDLVNRSFREIVEREKIELVGPASLQEVNPGEPFTFKVHVPVPPTVTLADYRNLRAELKTEEVTDETIQRALDMRRDKHVVLQELDEPRPAQQGDRLSVRLETIVDGESLNESGEDGEEEAEIPPSSLDLEPGRLVDELYEGLLGTNVGDTVEVTAMMPDDHANDQVRGKQVTFKAEILEMQSRLLPEWDELPTLEEFEGDLEALREQTRTELLESAKQVAERNATDSYVEQLLAQSEFDIPDVIVEQLAGSLLEEQGQQFSRYGITLDQMLQYRGQTREQAMAELMPEAEQRTRTTLALQEVAKSEQITVTGEELSAESDRMLLEYPEEQREALRQMFATQLQAQIANIVFDRKLRERILQIATGNAPELPAPAEPEPVEAEQQ